MNGDFSAGNFGFQSDYNENSDLVPGGYFVGKNPGITENTDWARSFKDYSGDGNMIIIDGDEVTNKRVYFTSVWVTEGNLYSFSAYIKNIRKDLVNSAQLRFYAANSALGTIDLPTDEQDWVQVNTTWEAPISGLVEIGIRNENTQAQGNDFALDNIVFSEYISKKENVTIDVAPKPIIAITATKDEICVGESVILTASGAHTYIWNNNIENGLPFEPLNTNTYKVIGTNQYNCIDSASYEIIVNELPIVNLGLDQVICERESKIFDAGSGMDSYLWNSGETSQTINKLTTGIYSVTVSKNNCTASDEILLTVNPLPIVDLGPDISICEGAEQIFDANSDMDSYLWNSGEISQTITKSNSGEYTVTVTKNNCISADTVILTLKPLPTIDLGSDKVICEGDTVILNAQQNLDSYTWNTGEITSSVRKSKAGIYSVTVSKDNCTASNQIQVVVNQLPTVDLGDDKEICQGEIQEFTAPTELDSYIWSSGEKTAKISKSTTGIYSVTVSKNQCLATDQIELTVKPLPIVDLGTDKEICEGVTQQFDAGSDFDSYLWSSGESTQTISKSTIGIYSVTVSKNQCLATDLIELTVKPLPIVDLGTDVEICEGETQLFDAGAGNYTFLWNSGETSQTIAKTENGIYSVTVNFNNCISSDEVKLTVNPIPEFYITGDTVFCEKETKTLEAKSLTNNTYTYQWQNGETDSRIFISNSGFYAATATNPFGCSSSSSKYVKVNPLPLPPVIIDTTLCLYSGNYPLNIIGENNTMWYSDQFAFNQIQPISHISTHKTADYYIYLRNRSQENCLSEISTTHIRVTQPIGKIDIYGNDSVCEYSTNNFYSALIENIHGEISWNVSTPIESYKSTGNSITIDWNKAGIDTIIASVYDTNYCIIHDTMLVKISPFPVSNFIVTENNSNSTALFENISEAAIIKEINIQVPQYYLWDFYETDSLIQKNNSKFSLPYEYGIHKVRLITVNEFGCKDTTIETFFIDIFTSLYIPNAFSPNNDALYVREFRPKGLNLSEYSIWIYDKWGNLIWYSDKLIHGEPAEGWNGTYDDQIMESGSYIWKIEAIFKNGEPWKGIKDENGNFKTRGSVILIR
ncbi:MAG: gliding motility-associated C-terminal domain-containing protein [Bacteroidales bacterium]|nr:gliding motility-associated C-terminal domain-containing protein [Bacteroidales bacterium]